LSTSTRFKGHVDLVGNGRPVLALAGLGCSNWIFEDMAAALAAHGTWIMPDNRGMGRSPGAPAPYEIADLAGDALDLMDDLGHDRFVVVGISMGGFIAQVLTERAPERIAGLILLCTTGPGERFVPLPEMPGDLIKASYRLDRETMIRANTDSTVFPGMKRRDPERYRAIFDKKLANIADLDQVLMQNEAARRFMSGSIDYDRYRGPALVMAGSGDRFVDPANATILAECLGSAETVVVEEADHLFFLEKPEETHRHIKAFLEAL